jgi:2-phosphoglycerate kinase
MDKESYDMDLEYNHVAHDSDENLSEDERTIQNQEEFERKYNFRFEEPDQEFIKRYKLFCVQNINYRICYYLFYLSKKLMFF